MNKKELLVWWLIIAMCVLFAFLMSGCSHASYTRTDYHPNGEVKTHVEVLFDELLMQSTMGGFHAKIDGEKREFTIGVIVREPDVNVVAGIISGVLEGLR